MGMGHVLTAEAYRRSVLGLDDHLLMLRFPAIGFATSHSASSDVTDSAAGGTALATGHKTRNGMIGMDADSVAVEHCIAPFQQRMGRRTRHHRVAR